MIINAGYRVHVTSWENDADNYQTKIVDGLSEPEVNFVVKLCKLHYSQNRFSECFGNMYEPSKGEIEEYKEAIGSLLDEFVNDIRIDYQSFDAVSGLLYELGLNDTEFYTRVFESIVIEFIPEKIILEDVTAQFMKV